jgi:hypothetical protein
MSNEYKQIGGFGIDTQYERDKINYRPDINYNKPKQSSGELSVDTDSQQAGELEVADAPIALSIWDTAIDILDNLKTLDQELSNKLQNESAKIPMNHIDSVKEYAKKFGHDISDNVPFSLYKATFSYPGSRESAIIQDIYEDYHSDIEGLLNAELYADVLEMRNDWLDMIEFIKKGLFLQVVPIEKLPSSISNEDKNLDEIYEAEEEMLDSYHRAVKESRKNGDKYQELLITNFESDEYYQSLKNYEDSKRNKKTIEKKINSFSEIGELVESKSISTLKAIKLITRTIDFQPYKENEQEILYHILKQYTGKEALTKGLQKISAIIKLSVDHKKANVNESKESLRGIAGRSMKSKINNSLVNGVHLRNEVSMDVHDLLDYFDGVPSSEGFDVVANHIATGLKQANSVYLDQSSDFYKAHTMDAELRRKKLMSLIDKDASRQVHRLLKDVVKYKDNVGKWSSETALSTWLNSLLEQRN